MKIEFCQSILILPYQREDSAKIKRVFSWFYDSFISFFKEKCMAGDLKSISFVIPCLNEKQTLPFVLEKINQTRSNDLSEYATEVIVSDNGSTDGSIEIAEFYGARVVKCEEKGYGAALKYGITQARHEIIVFADADDTYDFGEAPLLIHELEKGLDLVLGSRIKGRIYPGAMPACIASAFGNARPEFDHQHLVRQEWLQNQ